MKVERPVERDAVSTPSASSDRWGSRFRYGRVGYGMRMRKGFGRLGWSGYKRRYITRRRTRLRSGLFRWWWWRRRLMPRWIGIQWRLESIGVVAMLLDCRKTHRYAPFVVISCLHSVGSIAQCRQNLRFPGEGDHKCGKGKIHQYSDEKSRHPVNQIGGQHAADGNSKEEVAKPVGKRKGEPMITELGKGMMQPDLGHIKMHDQEPLHESESCS